MTKFNRFADIAEIYKAITEEPEYRARFGDLEPSNAYRQNFQETVDSSRIVSAEEATTAEMPDPFEAEMTTQEIVSSVFKLFAGTRLEPLAGRIAWGIVHSLHKVSEQLDGQADEAARKLKDLIGQQDGSEINSLELEEAQNRVQSLDEARDAIACMRDHAGEIYHAETGRPWSSPRGSTVSSKRTASVIAARDYLAGRAKARRELTAPEGPVVVFSGGQVWHDFQMLYDRLDVIHARVPNMVLATTAQNKGCDAIAAAWAASRKVKLVAFTLNRAGGAKAGFDRNRRLAKLGPVEAVVCQGSHLQTNLWQELKRAGVPIHAFRTDQQQAPDMARRA